MALNVQMTISENSILGEKIVSTRLVNQQVLDFDSFCDYLAKDSTVKAAGDTVAAHTPATSSKTNNQRTICK